MVPLTCISVMIMLGRQKERVFSCLKECSTDEKIDYTCWIIYLGIVESFADE